MSSFNSRLGAAIPDVTRISPTAHTLTRAAFKHAGGQFGLSFKPSRYFFEEERASDLPSSNRPRR